MALIVIYGAVEIVNFSFFVKESTYSQKEFRNFEDNGLFCVTNPPIAFACKNYEDYPYKVISESNFLCKVSYGEAYNYSGTYFRYPKILIDELSSNSILWAILYLFSYILMAFIQIFIILSSVVYIILSCYFPSLNLPSKLPQFLSFQIACSKIRIHSILLTGSLMSIFIILDFDQSCIQTEFGDEYREIYIEKSYSFAFFIMGLGLIPLFITSSVAAKHFIYTVKQSRVAEYGALYAYVLFELIIVVEQSLLLVHWESYIEKISHNANKYHNYYLILAFTQEKCQIILFWIYTCIFHNFTQVRVFPMASAAYAEPPPLSVNQVAILNRLNLTVINVEGNATFQILDETTKGWSTCNICLDDIKQGEQISNLSCNHIFHFECLKEWVKNNSLMSCPNCRADIQPKELDPSFTVNTKKNIHNEISFSCINEIGESNQSFFEQRVHSRDSE